MMQGSHMEALKLLVVALVCDVNTCTMALPAQQIHLQLEAHSGPLYWEALLQHWQHLLE